MWHPELPVMKAEVVVVALSRFPKKLERDPSSGNKGVFPMVRERAYTPPSPDLAIKRFQGEEFFFLWLPWHSRGISASPFFYELAIYKLPPAAGGSDRITFRAQNTTDRENSQKSYFPTMNPLAVAAKRNLQI